MITIQRIYGKGRHDGIFIGLTIALIAVFIASLLVKKQDVQTISN